MRALIFLLAVVPAFAQVTTSDHDLERVAEVALARDTGTSPFDLEVEVSAGRARVTGEVDTLKRRWEVLDTVGRVRGIASIEDELTVRPGGSDGAVRAAVERKLGDIPSLDRQSLEVRVVDGVVTLSGAVSEAGARLRAQEAAAKVPGARDVVLRLDVPTAPDPEVRAAVERVVGSRSLTAIPGEVRVEVADGTVTLTGTVPTVFARSQAERLAWGVDGVRAVRNALQVVP